MAAEVAAINTEIELLEVQRNDVNAKILALRLRREPLSKLLASKQVEAAVQSHVDQAADANQKAQAALAELEAKNKAADELLAKLAAQAVPPAETKPSE